MFLVTEPQIEGVAAVNKLLSETDHWGFVPTPFGRMFLGGNDDGILARLHHGYLYEPVSLALWQEHAAGAAILIDVGAHTGIYTLAALRAGAKRVIAIEPYFLNVSRLMLNLRANSWLGRLADCIFAAASRQHGVLGEIHARIKRGNETYCTAGPRLFAHGGSTAFPVRLVRIDQLISPERYGDVAMMKLDVEYSTRDALKGASALLEASQPDLLFECFESGVTDMLQPLGYQFWLIDELRGLTRAATAEAQAPDKFNRNYYASIRPLPEKWLVGATKESDAHVK